MGFCQLNVQAVFTGEIDRVSNWNEINIPSTNRWEENDFIISIYSYFMSVWTTKCQYN